MKRMICLLAAVLIAVSLSTAAFAAEFELDAHTTIEGMGYTWY